MGDQLDPDSGGQKSAENLNLKKENLNLLFTLFCIVKTVNSLKTNKQFNIFYVIKKVFGRFRIQDLEPHYNVPMRIHIPAGPFNQYWYWIWNEANSPGR